MNLVTYSYIEREHKPGKFRAARYIAGQPTDDLLAVARRMDPDAEITEVTRWNVLLVKSTRIPDDHPSYTDWEVVENGHWLVFSEQTYGIYAMSDEAFTREYMLVTP